MKNTLPGTKTASGLTTIYGNSNTSGRVTECLGFLLITSAAVIGCVNISTYLPGCTNFSTPFSLVIAPILSLSLSPYYQITISVENSRKREVEVLLHFFFYTLCTVPTPLLLHSSMTTKKQAIITVRDPWKT